MKILYIIFGILSFVVGIVFLINPFDSMMLMGMLLSIFLLLVGLFFILIYFMARDSQRISPTKPAIGVAGLLFGIALILLSVLAMAVSRMQGALEMIILIIFAVWMIFNGILSVFISFQVRKQDEKGWGITCLVGIIVTAAGLYGLVHMVIFGEALMIVLGILLLLYGVSLICSAFTDPDAVRESKREKEQSEEN